MPQIHNKSNHLSLRWRGGAAGWGSDLRVCLTALLTSLCASVLKQYKLVPANGRWHYAAGQVTVVDFSGLSTFNDSEMSIRHVRSCEKIAWHPSPFTVWWYYWSPDDITLWCRSRALAAVTFNCWLYNTSHPRVGFLHAFEIPLWTGLDDENADADVSDTSWLSIPTINHCQSTADSNKSISMGQ